MSNLLILSTLITIATAVAGELKPVPFTRSDHAIQATTKSGDTLLAAREMLVDVTYPSGRAAKEDILVLFDRATGLFYWHYWALFNNKTRPARIAEDFATNAQIYAADDRLVVFLGGYQSVGIRESSRHADSLDDAETKTLREAAELLGEIEVGALGKHFNPSEISLPFPREFFAPKGSAAIGRSRLIGVSRQGSSWELTVHGQWTAKVTLNEKYEVTATERVP